MRETVETDFEVPADKNIEIVWQRFQAQACRVRIWYKPAGRADWLYIMEVYPDTARGGTSHVTHAGLKAKDRPWRIKCECHLKIGNDFQNAYPEALPQEEKTDIPIYGQLNDQNMNTGITFIYDDP